MLFFLSMKNVSEHHRSDGHFIGYQRTDRQKRLTKESRFLWARDHFGRTIDGVILVMKSSKKTTAGN